MKTYVCNTLSFILLSIISSAINCACPPIEIPQKGLPAQKTREENIFDRLTMRAQLLNDKTLQQALTGSRFVKHIDTGCDPLSVDVVKLLTQYIVPIKIKIVANKEFWNFDCTITFRTMDGQLVRKIVIPHWSSDEKEEQAMDVYIQLAKNYHPGDNEAFSLMMKSLGKVTDQIGKRIARKKTNPRLNTAEKIEELPPFIPLQVDIEAVRQRCSLVESLTLDDRAQLPIKAHFELSAEELSSLNTITVNDSGITLRDLYGMVEGKKVQCY